MINGFRQFLYGFRRAQSTECKMIWLIDWVGWHFLCDWIISSYRKLHASHWTIGALNRQLSFSTWNAMTKSDSIRLVFLQRYISVTVRISMLFLLVQCSWLCLLKWAVFVNFLLATKSEWRVSWNHQFTRFIAHHCWSQHSHVWKKQ